MDKRVGEAGGQHGDNAGWLASAILLVERVRSLQESSEALSCDINPLRVPRRSLRPMAGVPARLPQPDSRGRRLCGTDRRRCWAARGRAIRHLVLAPLFTVRVFGAWLLVLWLYTQSVYVIVVPDS